MTSIEALHSNTTHYKQPLRMSTLTGQLGIATSVLPAVSSSSQQAIPEDEEQAGSLPPGVSTTGLTVGQIDELTLLLADTPLKKLRHKDAQAAKATAAGDPWAALELRQQQLALAKLCAITGPYSAQKRYPLLLAEAHYKLAAAYADMQCTPQANEHAKRCDAGRGVGRRQGKGTGGEVHQLAVKGMSSASQHSDPYHECDCGAQQVLLGKPPSSTCPAQLLTTHAHPYQ